MCWQSTLLPHVLNSTQSAACAEFASIVIELVILLVFYYPLETITCLLFSITNDTSCCEVNYNYRLLCLKTCNHYVVIAFVVFQLLQPWYTPTYIPMTIPICLRAMKTENTVVRSFLVVVRAKSPKMAAPAPAPTPGEKCPALTAYYIPRFTQQTNECYTS